MIIPEHDNDLGDWCPDSGKRPADGTCPQYCRDADEQAGFDAGRENDEAPDGPCQYSAAHRDQDVPAVTVIICGPVGKVPACQKCADFYARMS